MIEQGVRDFALAKRKAAERLRVSERGVLPSNAMIEERLAARQRIFEAQDHHHRLAEKRRVALLVMDALAGFDFEIKVVARCIQVFAWPSMGGCGAG